MRNAIISFPYKGDRTILTCIACDSIERNLYCETQGNSIIHFNITKTPNTTTLLPFNSKTPPNISILIDSIQKEQLNTFQ